MKSNMYDPLLEVKFFGLFYLTKFLLTKLNINTKISFWYTSFVMSLFINIYQIDFHYDLDYLIGQHQLYPHMSQLMTCLIIYLIEDLLFDQYIDKTMILHHCVSIVGLVIGRQGYFIGAINNTVLNEVSTIWLALFKITESTKSHFVQKCCIFFFVSFIFSFVTFRIIPLSKHVWINLYNFFYIFEKTHQLSILIMILNLIHTSIQYYWLYSIYRLTKKKTIKSI